MVTGWQDIAAIGLVALALGYLARAAYRAMATRRAGAGCSSGCGTCPGASAPRGVAPGGPLVTIGPPRDRGPSNRG